MTNPFDAVIPLESGAFFTRKRELDTVVSYLSKPRPHSVQLVGPTQVGKSTLVNQIRRLNFKSSLTHLVYLDCALIEDARSFLWKVLFEVSKIIDGEHGVAAEATPGLALPDIRRQFVRFFGTLDAKAIRVGLILDHFDQTVIAMGEDDLGSLRAIINSYRHAIVTVTNDRLANLAAHVRQSTLSELCAPVVVGLVDMQETLDIVQGYFAAESSRLTFAEQEFLAKYIGFYPAVLQRACYWLVEKKESRGQLTPADLLSLKEHIDLDVRSLLATMLEPLSKRQRRVLNAIASQEPVGLTDRQLVEVLRQRYSLVAQTHSGDAVFGEVLSRYLQSSSTSTKADQLDGLETMRSLLDDLGLGGSVLSAAYLHLKDATRLIGNNDWTSANASIRDVYQAVVDWLAEELQTPADAPFTDHGSKLQLLQRKGLLTAAERTFVQKFWALASTNGSHPGRSDMPATLLRFYTLTGIVTHLLMDYGRYTGVLTV